MVDVERNGHAECRFVLRPNRSLSWQGSLIFFFSLCLVSGIIAIGLALLGYWLVLPFTGLELLALGISLYVVARRCYQCEVICITGDAVPIEKGIEHPQERWTFSRIWARVVLERYPTSWYPSRLLIRSHGRAVEIGRFLNEEERQRLAGELTCYL